MESGSLSHLSDILISSFNGDREQHTQKGEARNKITVNPIVSEVASWYEKLRTAMDYRAEEVVLRAAIERILKRRILLGGDGKKIAEPLVRELIWARYFPDATVPETIVAKVARSIDLYLALGKQVTQKHKLKEGVVNEWIYHLLSSDLQQILSPNTKEDTMRNFMFQILKENITIVDDSSQTRDAQVFLAVSKSFAKDDIAFLRYHLFRQFFGDLREENLEHVSSSFLEYYEETQRQLNYRLKDRILSYVKNQTPPFLILKDVLDVYGENIKTLNDDDLSQVVFQACNARYSGIKARVGRAIIRSIIFILLTKTLFAFMIEGTYETLISGGISLTSMAINISIPPLLMIVVGLMIQTPGRDNSERILARIKSILFDDEPQLGNVITLRRNPDKTKPFINIIFTVLWLLAFALSFGAIFFVLSKLHFSIVTQGIFIFFLTIVAFLSYRISQTAHTYTVEDRQRLTTPLVDFLFMPIVQVGRHLTEGISQLNLLLFIFDFIIETPFKGLFAFFEQWFLFLHRKREEMG